MNILLLNHYAGSPAHGMEFRPYYLAREWVRQGHQVQIIACAQSHVRAKSPDLQGGIERVEQIDGITYRWLQAPAYRGNGVGRLLNILVFLARVLRRARSIVEAFKPDRVIASSTYPMDIWVARHMARRARCPWIYEVHDLWPLSLIELSGMSPRHPFALLCAWAERQAYCTADGVVSMLPRVHEHMAARGLDLKRLRIVPNGVAVEDWEPPARWAAAAPNAGCDAGRSPAGDPAVDPSTGPAIDPPTDPISPAVLAVLAQCRAQCAAVVAYAGSMGQPNALDNLLDAAALMRDEPVHFILVGDGHERERLVQRVRREALDRVHFLPPIPKRQIPAFLAEADVAYIGWQRVPLYRFGIAPNKLMDYMMARCAVLHAVEAGNDPVAESGCGLTVAPQDPQAAAAGLRQLLALSPAQRREMGERGRRHVVEHHAYSVLARRFFE